MIDRDFILARVRVDENGCWLWTGYINPALGRPILYRDGTQEYAYRASYRVFVGQIPDGKQINHHCDVPACVNPEHLYAGTHEENMRDMAARRRYVIPMLSGEDCANAYPDTLVDAVRDRYQRGEQQGDLASEYGIALGTVRQWCSGGARNREPIKRQRGRCGTRAGYCSHQRRGEKPCDSCRAANTAYLRDYKARRRQALTGPT